RQGRLDLVLAGAAVAQVAQGALAGSTLKLTVDERRDLVVQMVHRAGPAGTPPRMPSPLSSICRSASSFVAPYRIRSRLGARWSRALRSRERPRWMRERTVPILMPSTSAISSYDRPSMSHSTTAAR